MASNVRVKKQARGRPALRTKPIVKRPKRAHAKVTFDAVVIAAERVLVSLGVDGLTTNRVAETAGVSIGTLYQYFPNKEAIVRALFDRYLDELEVAIISALRSGNNVDDTGRAVLGCIAIVHGRTPAVFAHLWQLRSAAEVHDRISVFHEVLIREASATMKRLDLATPSEIPSLAFVIVHALDGVVNAAARTSGVDLFRIAHYCHELIRRLFLARPT